MEIVCEECKAKLNIPDEKVPQGQRVSVLCPRCKNKLIIDTTEARTEVSPPAADEPAVPLSPGQGPPDTSHEEAFEPSEPESIPEFDDAEEDDILDTYDEGEKSALVMENDAHYTEKIKEALEEIGYRYVPAENTQKAVGKMRFQNFDLVILSDHFDDVPLKQSPILDYLNHLSMSVRRKVFLVLISDKFKTMDHMMAFTMSANLVINVKNLDKVSTILKRAVSDNEKFYKVFFDTLKETGKA